MLRNQQRIIDDSLSILAAFPLGWKIAPILLFSFLILFLLDTSLCAEESDHRRVSLWLESGGGQPALNDSAQIWLFRPYFGGGLQFRLTPKVGLLLSTQRASFYNDSIGTSLFERNRDRANRKWQVTSLEAATRFYLNDRSNASPFIQAGIEALFWKMLTFPTDTVMRMEDRNGDLVDYTATELGLSTGFGFEKLFGDHLGITMLTSFTYLTGIGVDFTESVENACSRGLLRFSAAFSYHLGRKKKSSEEHVPETKARSIEEKRSDTLQEIRIEPSDTARIDHGIEDQIDNVPLEQSEPLPVVDDDLDGVPDARDECPETPRGALVDSAGCPLDTDFDGVPDYRDSCLATAPNLAVDPFGCPFDEDHDGVVDRLDSCPSTPRGLAVDQQGCPDLERLFHKRVLSGIFLPGGGAINEAGEQVLDSLVYLLNLFPRVKVEIAGYTDDIGPADANQKLSVKRAKMVRSYFVKRGISAGRMSAVGLGETNFITSNRTKEGRESNRRVELDFKY